MNEFLRLFRAWQSAEAAAVTAERRLRKLERNTARGGAGPSGSLVREAKALQQQATQLLAAAFAAGAVC